MTEYPTTSPSELFRLVASSSPKGALDVVLSCIRDEDPRWEPFLCVELACQLSGTVRLEKLFFEALLSESVPAFAAAAIQSYVSKISPASLARLFGSEGLAQRKNCFVEALERSAFQSVDGDRSLEVVRVLLPHIASPDLTNLIGRRWKVLHRACLNRRRELFKLIGPKLELMLPLRLLLSLVQDEVRGEEHVGFLVSTCGFPIDLFEAGKVLSTAAPTTRSFIFAYAGRSRREPERPPERR